MNGWESGGRGKGGLLVSQYSLLGAHDPAWLTLLPLSSGATIHHDTGVGGRAKIQPGGAIHRDTAQWEIVSCTIQSGQKEAWRWPGQGWRTSLARPHPHFLSSDRPQMLCCLIQVFRDLSSELWGQPTAHRRHFLWVKTCWVCQCPNISCISYD